METFLQDAFPKTKTVNGKVVEWVPTVVRYADDFVICHRDLTVMHQCQTLIQQWLHGLGLELKPNKTRITHTFRTEDGAAGFDFLGFSIRQYPAGKYHTGKDTRGRPLGFKTLTQPSKAKVALHHRQLTAIVRRPRAAPQAALIRHLNPVIQGWCNYYRTAASKRTFRKASHVLYRTLLSWARRRHPHQGQRWITQKYWRLPRWALGTKQGLTLFEHERTKIVRHIKVPGRKSPFDGDWTYWAGRQGHYPGMGRGLALLLKYQQGRCAHCGLYFMPGDLLEVHHREGDHTHKAGHHLAVLHRHCHDAVHGQDQLEPERSIHDKDCPGEEPYECESLKYGCASRKG